MGGMGGGEAGGGGTKRVGKTSGIGRTAGSQRGNVEQGGEWGGKWVEVREVGGGGEKEGERWVERKRGTNKRERMSVMGERKMRQGKVGGRNFGKRGIARVGGGKIKGGANEQRE